MATCGSVSPLASLVQGHLDSIYHLEGTSPQSQAAVKWRMRLWGQYHIHPVLNPDGDFVYVAACS